MRSFFLAVPDAGASYLFGFYSDGPDAALAHFRELHPGARVRLLVVKAPWAEDAHSAVYRTMVTRTSMQLSEIKWVLHHGKVFEVYGETPAGLAATEALVRAAAFGDAIEGALPPLETTRAPCKFFFAHAGETLRNHRIGIAHDPVENVRSFRARHPGEAVTLYSGNTPRAAELVAAVSAVLETSIGRAPDPGLVPDFLLPLFRTALGRGEGGLRIQELPAGA